MLSSGGHRGIVTVQQHIIQTQRDHPTATGEFSWLLSAITLAGKIIGAHVRRAGLVDVLGAAGEEEGGLTNPQGETVQKLDLLANDTLKHTLGYRGNVGIIASEEDDEPRVIQEAAQGRYIVLFDPLDGSSNIDVTVSVGTIFSILQRGTWDEGTGPAVLQPGSRQVAAGYVLYGSSTVLVLTTGSGVNMFTLDPTLGAFMLTRENIRMPEYRREYSVNEAYLNEFPPPYRDYLAAMKTERDGQRPSMRYVGSLVADFHRILLRGGLFLYPPTAKMPAGKLRLLYEANPLAMVAEQAGGAATDGKQRILAVPPTSLHQRTPLVIGSKRNMVELEGFLVRRPDGAPATEFGERG